jgi:hypothetical protein
LYHESAERRTPTIESTLTGYYALDSAVKIAQKKALDKRKNAV